jgi:hypothetical protein
MEQRPNANYRHPAGLKIIIAGLCIAVAAALAIWYALQEDGRDLQHSVVSAANPTVQSPAPPQPGTSETKAARLDRPDSAAERSATEPAGRIEKIYTFSEVQKRVADLERRVLAETETANLLVETFGARIGRPVPADVGDGSGNRVAADVPGYIAFSPTADSAGRLPYTMARIAELYFDAFPQAPRLTISVIRGGGVVGSETYHNSTKAASAE